MALETQCPIWKTPATHIGTIERARFVTDSPRAGGQYAIELEAWPIVGNEPDPVKLRLTGWLVNQRRTGTLVPTVTLALVEAARTWEDVDVSIRVDNLLRYLEAHSPLLGTQITFRRPLWDLYKDATPDKHEIRSWEMFAHSGCRSQQDFEVLLDYLKEQKFINHIKGDVSSCCLLVAGYGHLAELREVKPDSRTAFVAMWFHDSMTDAYEDGIKPAIEDAGYEPVRIDRQDYVNRIDDQIISEIRRARFVVADFTRGDDGSRGSVYYEAGFAHGLGRNVVFTCREDCIGRVDFDTRQYNHIVWKRPQDLRASVRNRILAAFGEGPIGPLHRT